MGKRVFKYDEGGLDPMTNLALQQADNSNTDNASSNGEAVIESGEPSGEKPNDGGLPEGYPKWLAGYSKEQWETLKDYQKPSDFAKVAIESLEKGDNLPDENTSPEDLKTFYKKLGTPDKAEDYPELDTKIEGVTLNLAPYKKAGIEAGLTPTQFKVYNEALLKNTQEAVNNVLAENKQKGEQVATKLKEKDKNNYESLSSNADIISKGLLEGAGLQLTSQIQEDPAYKVLALELAKTIGDGKLPNGSGGGTDGGRRAYTFKNTPSMS